MAKAMSPTGRLLMLCPPAKNGAMTRTSRLHQRPFTFLCCASLFICLPSLAQSDSPSACSQVLTYLTTCPSVPAVSNVNLTAYTGRWFVIGSNAQAAFDDKGLQEGQCLSSNYTLISPLLGRTRVRVVSRALVFTSNNLQDKSRKISGRARDAGVALRFLCQLLAGSAPIAKAFPDLHAYSKASPTGPQGSSSSSSSAASDMAKAVSRMDQSASTTRNSVQAISTAISAALAASPGIAAAARATITAQVSGLVGSMNSALSACNSVFTALEGIQRSNADMNGASLPAVFNLTAELADVQQGVAVLQGAGDAVNSARLQIAQAAQTIKGLAGRQGPKVADAAESLNRLAGKYGPLAQSIQGLTSAARALGARAERVKADSLVPPRVVVQTGTASQRSGTDKKGSLSLSFGFPVLSPNYNIIKLDGNASTGYSSALVYDCDSGPSTDFVPQITVYLLSRTPSMSASAVQTSLDFLLQQGILLGGENTFVTVSQNSTLCQNVTSTP